ncbi:MAG TPA: oxidoreductase, partial [Candidatus Limnocylindrales bacterium]|nr:oxidoreductase [Candidatus Limnocylindrales bacterium]
ADLNVNVFPFILRGVSLLGVDSVEIPMRARQMAWNKLAGDWSVDLSRIVKEVSLEALDAEIDKILKGGVRGRVVVDLSK